MDSFAKIHQFIKINNGKKCYSIGLLKENNSEESKMETRSFYKELEEYIEELKLHGSLRTIIVQVNYGIKMDDNCFSYSNIYENCYVSEIHNNDIEGGNCTIMLQVDSNNKDVLNLILVLTPEEAREPIC